MSLHTLYFRMILAATIVFACRTGFAEDTFPTLRVGPEVYSNVTVTTVTATDIYFTHSRGMANAKLKDLDPGLQQKFHFDPQKASEAENRQKQANANFLASARNGPVARPASRSRRSDSLDPDPYISVETAPESVQYKYYDPIYGRPSELGRSPAKVHCAYDFDPDFTVQPVSEKFPFAFRIVTVKVSIALPMTITTPSTPVEELKTYLDGGQRIYEHFYELAPRAAERAAHVVGSGRNIVPRGTDLESARSDFLARAKRMAQQEYAKYTEAPAGRAIAQYGVLTDYSLNHKDRDEAVREAIQKYEVPIPED